ncbi:MAG: dienelactone hydrolase family protein [Deltaproteobacteria bacterium]|nr:dienelactone hydrolase family protein [Deltaproteobacteria bacterium]
MAIHDRYPLAPPRDVHIAVDDVVVEGTLTTPWEPRGVVVFAHGSGSSRFSPRNQAVARTLQESGFATLLLDLLTQKEEIIDERTRRLRFDIDLLARRLGDAVRWVRRDDSVRGLPIGLFGASTGAAAALMAAAVEQGISAVVSRGGRPDLADVALQRVQAPTLLIVGGDDVDVLRLNRAALHRLAGPAELAVVAGATHLFEEPGALEQVAGLARSWFLRHLHGVVDVGIHP